MGIKRPSCFQAKLPIIPETWQFSARLLAVLSFVDLNWRTLPKVNCTLTDEFNQLMPQLPPTPMAASYKASSATEELAGSGCGRLVCTAFATAVWPSGILSSPRKFSHETT